jgi:hypothetical protein
VPILCLGSSASFVQKVRLVLIFDDWEHYQKERAQLQSCLSCSQKCRLHDQLVSVSHLLKNTHHDFFLP